jgi:small multidrug resistance pump
MSPWFFLAIAIVAEVIGTSFLKSSDGFTRPGPSFAVIVSYMLAFYFLALSLRTIPVGIAYAVWAGAGIGLIALIGWVIFGQRLDAAAILGIGLIVAGVVVLNVFSATTPHGMGQP